MIGKVEKMVSFGVTLSSIGLKSRGYGIYVAPATYFFSEYNKSKNRVFVLWN